MFQLENSLKHRNFSKNKSYVTIYYVYRIVNCKYFSYSSEISVARTVYPVDNPQRIILYWNRGYSICYSLDDFCRKLPIRTYQQVLDDVVFLLCNVSYNDSSLLLYYFGYLRIFQRIYQILIQKVETLYIYQYITN